MKFSHELAPLFFPSRSFNQKKSHRPLLRTTSSASIYAPPVLQHSVSAPVPLVRNHSQSRVESRADQQPSSTISGRTPGRRGEKRKRPQAEEDEKKRKSGKIVLDKATSQSRVLDTDIEGDEDIFGKRPSVKSSISFELPTKSDGAERVTEGEDRGDDLPSTAKKRPRVPQQILDNKAVSPSLP